jgi:hypothetical protein
MLTLDTKSTMWYIQRNPLRQTKGLEKGWTEKERHHFCWSHNYTKVVQYTVYCRWALGTVGSSAKYCLNQQNKIV